MTDFREKETYMSVTHLSVSIDIRIRTTKLPEGMLPVCYKMVNKKEIIWVEVTILA